MDFADSSRRRLDVPRGARAVVPLLRGADRHAATPTPARRLRRPDLVPVPRLEPVRGRDRDLRPRPRGKSAAAAAAARGLWRLFLPKLRTSSPTSITCPEPRVRIWSTSSDRGAGRTGSGSASLARPGQPVVRSRAGARGAWSTAIAVLGFASSGATLGRDLRWNSLDVRTHPRLRGWGALRTRRDLRRPARDRDDRAPVELPDAELPRPLCVHAARGRRGTLGVTPDGRCRGLGSWLQHT